MIRWGVYDKRLEQFISVGLCKRKYQAGEQLDKIVSKHNNLGWDSSHLEVRKK